MTVTDADHETAGRVADAAGELLVSLRSRMIGEGCDQDQLKAEGDRQSHELIMQLLGEAAPDDAVLSEEGADDLERLNCERVWIVDPLDGTREFGEVPREDWAVHVALSLRGDPVVGAVALPAQGMTLSTRSPASLPARNEGPPRLIVSRSRPPKVATALADELGGVLVEMGSAGAKAMAVVQGLADIYAHGGGQFEWDSAAPVAVARAAGCHVSRLSGQPLVYNNENPYLPDLLICRPEFVDDVLAVTGRLGVN